jgi:hypothetical protein
MKTVPVCNELGRCKPSHWLALILVRQSNLNIKLQALYFDERYSRNFLCDF